MTVRTTCEAHTDKTALGWWLALKMPAKCDHCDAPAAWVLVQQDSNERNPSSLSPPRRDNRPPEPIRGPFPLARQ